MAQLTQKPFWKFDPSICSVRVCCLYDVNLEPRTGFDQPQPRRWKIAGLIETRLLHSIPQAYASFGRSHCIADDISDRFFDFAGNYFASVQPPPDPRRDVVWNCRRVWKLGGPFFQERPHANLNHHLRARRHRAN
jgi:hypothetical protein